jgi:hypothetical protein
MSHLPYVVDYEGPDGPGRFRVEAHSSHDALMRGCDLLAGQTGYRVHRATPLESDEPVALQVHLDEACYQHLMALARERGVTPEELVELLMAESIDHSRRDGGPDSMA